MAEYKQGDFVIRTRTDASGKLVEGAVGLVVRKVNEKLLDPTSSLWVILDEQGEVVEWSSVNIRRLEDE